MCILDKDDMFLSLAIWTVNPAFNAGSSKQGNALLASVDSNWVAATTLYKGYFQNWLKDEINFFNLKYW